MYVICFELDEKRTISSRYTELVACKQVIPVGLRKVSSIRTYYENQQESGDERRTLGYERTLMRQTQLRSVADVRHFQDAVSA